jgi:MraZ protein
VFTGRNAVAMDAKGRLTVPARFRDALLSQYQGKLTLTLNIDPCLRLLPRPLWEAFAERLSSGAADIPRRVVRMFLTSALDVDIDGAGRILIPAELREPVRLEPGKDVMLAGVGRSFEIWNAELLTENDVAAAKDAEALNNVLFD